MKIVPKEFLASIYLIRGQTFYIYKLTKVIVICKNKNFVFIIFHIILLGFKDFINNQKFTIISSISSFSLSHFYQKMSYQVLFRLNFKAYSYMTIDLLT